MLLGCWCCKAFGHAILDAHYKAYLYAGINISGTNGEVMSGQGDWNGAGAHANYCYGISSCLASGEFCTKSIRSDGEYETTNKKAIEKLGLRHKEHIAAYGEGNEHRLTKRTRLQTSTTSFG
ncbi:hypothetical protein I3760_15G128800 [Carya illinoinensis]|nr:hypothetical protein I3760_15G128800 [Carya illinoinensis]